ncbi:peptide ABC transporter substrate-binding protein [Roseovarius aestuarii]|nr:peptide ABC transporter substrate-binding protein [Roseovarius aestuarii]
MQLHTLAFFVAPFITLASTVIPAHSSDAQQGRDGEVRILYWQAPSILNPYLSGGIKDVEAASLVLEPLARLNPDGVMTPWLATEIPTLDNGGVSADLTRITWHLTPGLTWSDGSPLTARDVQFTFQYCTATDGACAQKDKFRDLISVETPDDLTAVLQFSAPRPYPYGPFVGPQTPILQAAQFADCIGPRAPGCTEQNFAPIGTGPYTVQEFRPNDAVRFTANPNYRDEGKPAFGSVMFKGGTDANAAGRAVLETGEFDYAWNLQLAPEVLDAMAARGKGSIITAFSTLVERITFNMTNPDPALGEDRATLGEPHPALSDLAVRQALAMALDRDVMTQIGYGPTGRTTCNIIPAPPIYASSANDGCAAQDLEGARALLSSAGWVDSDGDGVRQRDGTHLRFTFQTSTNAVRQNFQLLAKEWWRQIGVATELRNIDASVFFGSDPSSPDTMQKFYADIEMYAGASDGPDPASYLGQWACGRAPSPDNAWQGSNVARFCDPEYDTLLDKLTQTAGLAERAEIARQMNDMLVQNYVVVPLVDRGRVSARSNSLAGVQINAWDSELWNIAEWRRVTP